LIVGKREGKSRTIPQEEPLNLNKVLINCQSKETVNKFVKKCK